LKKGRPFLEIFASALHEDYRFPLLELFAFLYTLGAFGFATALTDIFTVSNEIWVYMLISTLMGVPLLVFLLLVFKNVAYGLGGDLEKGTIQTLLSYPLKRWKILTAKLLSALGAALLLFFGIQLAVLVIMAPSVILPNIGIILLTYFANCGYVLLLTTIILLITLFIKKGGIGLVVGIAVYFSIGIVTSMIQFVALVTGSTAPLQIIALLNPSTAVSLHYGVLQSIVMNIAWQPTLTEAVFYVIGNYAITALLFSLAYYYFCRRLSI